MAVNVFEVLRAVAFAERAHRQQRRKYSDDPYIQHPIAVALLVASIPNISTEAVIAALLHDVVEDCGISIETITRSFGKKVGRYVKALSDLYDEFDGNRDEKLDKTIERLAKAADPEIHTIKLADICCNSAEIIIEDPNFARKYMPEKKRLLAVLTKGHPALMARANGFIEQWELYEEARRRVWPEGPDTNQIEE